MKFTDLVRTAVSPLWSFTISCKQTFALIVVEACLLAVIIKRVNYTEIDWIAYIQEVEGFLNGSRNYTELKGDTGPLVYPAGFVYIYSGLYYIYKWVDSLQTMQFIFGGLYLANLFIILRIYNSAKQVPLYAMAFITFTAYRVHSIYVLRLFNDPVAMFLAYCAIAFFQKQKWLSGSIFFSLAVGVKMNVMLFAPGLFVLLIYYVGFKQTFGYIAVCGIIQLLLGLPFLIFDPVAYISQSFNLGRVFFYKWTVNWRFIPEDIFLSRAFHISLLLLHIFALIFMGYFVWKKILSVPVEKQEAEEASRLIPFVMFTSNFCGIVFSRSLHYQFYVWYFHAIPFLLWSTQLPTIFKIACIFATEYAWNTYPSTNCSSFTLELINVTILLGLLTTSVIEIGKGRFKLFSNAPFSTKKIA